MRAVTTGQKAKTFGIAAGACIAVSIAVIGYESYHFFGKTVAPSQSLVASVVADPTVVTQSTQNVLPNQLPTQERSQAETVKNPTVEDERPKQYWRYLVIAVTLTFCVWVCRIVIRIMMSNLHSSSDAEERVTMLQTFLSLMSDKSINRQDDVRLILQTVFRPGTTGLVEEESGMQTPLEMILKNVSGGNKPGA